MGAEADWRGMISTVSPEVRDQSGHVEGLAQRYQMIIMPGGIILGVGNCEQIISDGS